MRGNMSKRRQITLSVNDQTLEAIEELKSDLDVGSTAAVIRKALALARVAVSNADDQHAVTILGQDDQRHKVLLAG